MGRRLAGIAASFVALVAVASAEEFKIGTQGATLVADSAWKRKVLNADMGPDQFSAGDTRFALVLEQKGVFELRSDFEAAIEGFVTGASARFERTESVGSFQYELRGNVGHASRHFTARISGVNLAYHLDLVARDGLGYLVMTWSEASAASSVALEARKLAVGISFPGPDSEWGRSAIPVARSFRFDDWVLELTYRGSLFAQAEVEKPGRVTLSSIDGDTAVHLFLDRAEGDVDKALDMVRRAVTKAGGYEELSRSEVEHELGPARELLLEKGSGDEGFDLAILVIELADGIFADLRMATSHPARHREQLWTSFTDSLRATPPRTVDAFPVVATGAASSPAAEKPNSDLLDVCTVVATLGWGARVVETGGGGLLAVESSRVLRLPPGAGEPEELFSTEDWLGLRSVASQDRDVLVVDKDSQVMKIVDADLEPAGFGAARIASSTGGIVLTRTEQAPKVTGFAHIPNLNPTRVLLRDTSGKETMVAELPGAEVQDLAVSRQRGEALLAVADRRPFADEGVELASRETLVVVALKAKASTSLGEWASVTGLAAADSGWLVSGSPMKGDPGLHLVGKDGTAELLVAGSATGVTLEGGVLTFLSPCLPDVEKSNGRCIYRGPLEKIREHGKALGALDGPALNALADELGDRLRAADSAPAIAEVVASASALSHERSGMSLPTSAEGIDRLLVHLSGSDDLSDGAVALLGALVTNRLVADGAEWVDGAAPSRATSLGGNGIEGGTLLAVAVRPLQVVMSTLFQEEGWSSPLSEIREQVEGRKILIGSDRAALIRKLREYELADAATMAREARPSKLEELLLAYPGNEFLREGIYRLMLASGQTERVIAVAGSLVKAGRATPTDRKAWLAARLITSSSSQQAEVLVTDLRHAIGQSPGTAGLYLILAAAYERTSRPDREVYARACYAKATSTAGWGELKADADAALARLDGKE